MSGKAIVKKSNQLVNARFDFSVLEIRLFTLMISQISKDDDDFKTYEIPIQDFVKTFKIKNKNIYKEIGQVTDSLIKKIVKIPIEEWGKKKLFKTSLINSFTYNIDGSGIIEATFHPDLKPFLLQLKSRFLMYDMKHVLNISSSNSIRMYELLKAFEGIGKRTFEVEELKEILGVEEKYNGRYYNFKKRIILQAQHDLEKYTDISFSFKESKIPWTKKVGAITFHISSHKKQSQKKEGSNQTPLLESPNSLVLRLNKYKFSGDVIYNEILKKYEESFIINTLNHCESYFKQNNAKNKEGFIIKALEKRFYEDEINTSFKRKAEEAKRQEIQSLEEKQKALEFEERNNVVETFLSGLSKEEKEEYKVEFF